MPHRITVAIPAFAVICLSLLWPLPSAFPISDDINTVRLGEASLTFSSGFIRRSMPIEGVITSLNGDAQTNSNKMILGEGDICYLQMAKNSRMSPGDHLTIYRRTKEIFHPAKGKYLGDLFVMVGIARVMEVTQDLATIRLVRSWSPITQGDNAIHFVAPGPGEPPVPGRSLPNTPGWIVSFPPSYTLIGQTHVVYIDWGRQAGLGVGDRLDVLREAAGLPPRKIGELRVLALEDETATALITRSTIPFLRGDRIIFRDPNPPQTAEQRPAGESVSEELDRLSKDTSLIPPLQEASQQALGAADGSDIDLSRLAALARQLEFEPGAAPANPGGLPALKEIGEILQTVPDRHFVIEGHTDPMPIGPSLQGEFKDNVALSEARAKGIVRYLVEEAKINPANLTVAAKGDSKPVASNATEEGRKLNRRIEIKLGTKGSTPVAASAPGKPSVPKPADEEPISSSTMGETDRVLPPSGSPAPAH
jgi:chemotaxis protein MotB